MRPVRKVVRKLGSSDLMAIGIYWRSGVAHHTLVILLCSTDVDVVGISVVSKGSGDRSGTVRYHHYV